MWTDAFAAYLAALKIIGVVLAFALLISGIDDLIIDVVYWIRRLWRAITVYRVHPRLDAEALRTPMEKPLAIMVPAWNETGVIGKMAELAATTLDYENYHVFVGTYPNDPDTQHDVDEVCARFKNVHKVVCARPGPTSKADCLNNVLDAILQFERRTNLEFAGFVLHDAEDVLAAMELRLFNYLVARKDLIQLPVYPLERRWSDFTSAHYMDEFAELHGKDILVREALAGQVPSAGVGTCFSRRAVLALLADGDGTAFDVQSLTEDYDIGFRLRAKGMSEIFVRFPVPGQPVMVQAGANAAAPFGTSARESTVVCVREFFPNTFAAAVRQKARWIVGIVYQGAKTHGWTNEAVLNYFLWRDRKGGINNFIGFFATLFLLQLMLLWAYDVLVMGEARVTGILEGEYWLTVLLTINLGLMINRIAQRMFFVSMYYGFLEGVLSVARVFWGSFINFMANWRAVRLIVQNGDARRVAWDKTSHEFPVLGEPSRARRPLGHILIQRGAITEAQLNEALAHRAGGLKLGSWLVHEGWITPDQLAAAVSEQSGVPWEHIDALAIAEPVIHQMPEQVALRYAVLPIREEGRTLVVASEGDLDRVSTAALARKLKRPITYVIAPKGQVTVGLRHWYARHKTDDGRWMLDGAVKAGRITTTQADSLWQTYVSRQVLFTEVLMSLGHIDAAALNAVLLRHERSSLSLGEYLVREGVVAAPVLQEALTLQDRLQGSMKSLLDRAEARAV